MKKLIQLAFLITLLNVSTVKPFSSLRLFLGTTALVTTTAIAYHIWTHYNVTRTLKRLFNRRCDELDQKLTGIKKDTEDLKLDSAENKELLKRLQEATGETKQMLLLLLQMQFSHLSDAQKRAWRPILEQIGAPQINAQ
ncbi:TPA: hypothetical protein DIC20_02920 [Candidatus Dependentiae bacterium]|nr:MAG: hypothetical protein US03_C0009G0039 [candidate division TM6 bacterium GW2011_GWF2_36_131]KKQ02878.1 MAG: hypothetical protein US13_C0009G0070 [candidate division TM6 bacterium GW2011_GWE2_36_25]KKQ19530.1 MAG: hypothetical protein US32_C0008G0031 [candidate division TM6 bacterium GW2011_GWA2_36_9]HBR70243.1 hypothetical protein [Candidatus Dependentiae bacterium]HCU00627.1 hypothetical protein [Candidatus Dependentiae bacterium]